jgi:hypothetical protein
MSNASCPQKGLAEDPGDFEKNHQSKPVCFIGKAQ